MKGYPGFVILPFNLFFELKEKYYSELSGKPVYLVNEPFVVKVTCEFGKVLLSVSPGSLVGDLEEMIDLGGCVANEYFWFEGSEVTWKVKSLPDWMEGIAKSIGVELGDGREVLDVSKEEGEVNLLRPWHPSARALEEGLECVGGDGEGLEVAKCGPNILISVQKERIYVGKVKELWRLMPTLVYATTR